MTMARDQGITSRHDHSVTDRTPVHIGLPFAPRAPLRAALAELIFRAGFRNLPVRVILPDGQRTPPPTTTCPTRCSRHSSTRP
jgi:hypothetical protein